MNEPRDGKDEFYLLVLPKDVALNGGSIKISYDRDMACLYCNETGADERVGYKKCSKCHGKGKYKEKEITEFGKVKTEKVCPDCKGSGKVPYRICPYCNGFGRVRERGELRVDIPKRPTGMHTGDKLTIQGKGEGGFHGGKDGNLVVDIKVEGE